MRGHNKLLLGIMTIFSYGSCGEVNDSGIDILYSHQTGISQVGFHGKKVISIDNRYCLKEYDLGTTRLRSVVPKQGVEIRWSISGREVFKFEPGEGVGLDGTTRVLEFSDQEDDFVPVGHFSGLRKMPLFEKISDQAYIYLSSDVRLVYQDGSGRTDLFSFKVNCPERLRISPKLTKVATLVAAPIANGDRVTNEWKLAVCDIESKKLSYISGKFYEKCDPTNCNFVFLNEERVLITTLKSAHVYQYSEGESWKCVLTKGLRIEAWFHELEYDKASKRVWGAFLNPSSQSSAERAKGTVIALDSKNLGIIDKWEFEVGAPAAKNLISTQPINSVAVQDGGALVAVGLSDGQVCSLTPKLSEASPPERDRKKIGDVPHK